MRRELLALALVACHGKDEAAEETHPAATVTCKPAAAATIHDVIDVTGVIAPPPQLDVTLSSPIAGRVGVVAVEEGDRVAAGALLATIEDPALPAGAAEAGAVVAGARATKLAADQELARQQRLVDAGIGARRDLDEARAKAAAATAELDASLARSTLAGKNNARRQLRAPYAGIVLHIYKRVGETVDGTSPVVEVANTATLELRANVPAAALAKLHDGEAATVTAGGAALPARVVRVSPAVDPTTLLGTVRVQIDATQPLVIGSAATGQIVVAEHAGVLVPIGALRRSMVGADEVVVCDKAVAHVRVVELGQRGEATAEIVKGIAAGEEIVVDHALGIEENQPLERAK
jgi:RND family efflux transporter MFP subunit